MSRGFSRYYWASSPTPLSLLKRGRLKLGYKQGTLRMTGRSWSLRSLILESVFLLKTRSNYSSSLVCWRTNNSLTKMAWALVSISPRQSAMYLMATLPLIQRSAKAQTSSSPSISHLWPKWKITVRKIRASIKPTSEISTMNGNQRAPRLVNVRSNMSLRRIEKKSKRKPKKKSLQLTLTLKF